MKRHTTRRDLGTPARAGRNPATRRCRLHNKIRGDDISQPANNRRRHDGVSRLRATSIPAGVAPPVQPGKLALEFDLHGMLFIFGEVACTQ